MASLIIHAHSAVDDGSDPALHIQFHSIDGHACIIELFALCTGGNFNIHIWAVHACIIELFALCTGGNFNIHIWAVHACII